MFFKSTVFCIFIPNVFPKAFLNNVPEIEMNVDIINSVRAHRSNKFLIAN